MKKARAKKKVARAGGKMRADRSQTTELQRIKALLSGLSPPVLGASVDRTFTGVSAQSAAIVGTVVRLVAKTADCRVAFGADPTAVATSTLLIAGVPEAFQVTSGHKIAAIRDAADGTLNITVIG